METVKIKDDNRRGWKIINKSDFDPKTQEVYGAKKSEPKPAKKKADK